MTIASMSVSGRNESDGVNVRVPSTDTSSVPRGAIVASAITSPSPVSIVGASVENGGAATTSRCANGWLATNTAPAVSPAVPPTAVTR
jgi:hypothetical protein